MEVRNLSSTNSYRLLGITEHPEDTAPIKNSFYYPFRPLFDRRPVERNKVVENWSKSCIWSRMDKTILLKCLVTLNYQLEIVGEKFVTSIGYSEEFYENLLFDRSIY